MIRLLPHCLLSLVMLCVSCLSWAAWEDVTPENGVTLESYYFNRVAKATTAHIVVTPPETTSLLRLVLENPSPDVLNADGVTEAGQPYFTINASSSTIAVNFTTTRTTPSFTGKIEQESANEALSLNPVGDLSVTLGSSFLLPLATSGTEGGTVRFDVSPLPLPANATLDPQTGLFSFTPESDQVGSYTLTFSVTDGVTSDSESITLTVEPPDANGITELTGRILDANAFANGQSVPLAGVVVSMLGTNASATTDAQGNFTLTNIPDGEQVLDLNASNATSSNDVMYAGFRESIDLIAHVNNQVSRPFFLPQLEAESLAQVDPSQTTVVSNTRLGVSLTVPPNTAFNADGTAFTGSLSISEVPPELAPAPLPRSFRPAMLVTIQPVGVRFSTPVPIIFPNSDNLPAGSEMNIWSIDPDEGSFVIVATGRVSNDGSEIQTISGGIRAADWHFPIEDNPDGTTDNDDQSNDNDGDGDDECVGSRSNIGSGCLKISHSLAAYQSLGESRQLRFTYNSESAAPFPVATVQTSINSRTAAPVAFRARLNSVGGIQMGNTQFVAASRDAMRHAIQFDAARYPTGQYPYEMEVSSEYERSGISTILKDFILINNEVNSPFGAGWTLEGLQRLNTVAGNERATLSEGTGAIKTFIPQGAVGEQPTDLAFLIDGSGSVGRFDFTLQLEGVASAVENPLIIPHDGSVSLVLIQFARFGAVTEVPLTTIDSEATALQVAAQIRAVQRQSGGTPITAGVNLAVTELAAGRDDARKVIFVSTDGQPNSASSALQAANNAVASGITEISAIGIGPGANLTFLESFVRNGSVFSAANFTQFAASIGEKLRVIVGGSPAGDFSFITKRSDGTFLRRMKTGEQVIFNAAGYQTAMIDRNNNETRYDYDAQNRLIQITDPVGKITLLTYGSDGKLSTITDPAGRTTQFTYVGGNLTSITDPDGTVRRFEYSGHLLVKQFDKKNQPTAYVYDHQNRFLRSDRPDNTSRGLIPSKTKALVTVASSKSQPAPGASVSEAVSEFTNGKGDVTRYVTDKLGNIIRMIDALGRVTVMERDDNGLVTKLTEPNGNVTEYSYDARGNLLTVHRVFDNATTSITYDPNFSLPLTLTDARGNTTTIDRDAQGNIIRITNALGHITQMSYNTQGLVEQMTSPNGLITDYTYNAEGLVESITETPPQNGGLTRVTQFSYDAIGNMVQSTSPQGVVVNYTYDALNRILEISNQQNERIRYDYDAQGNQTVVESIDPDNSLVTQMERDFDELHRLKLISRPHENNSDSITRFTRDGDGNVVAEEDPNQDEMRYVYDAVNKVIRDIDALGGLTEYQYNPNDVVTQITASNGATTNYTLDLLNRTVRETSPDRGTVQYVYDKNHNITRTTDGRNITANYTYDALNRVTRVTYPNTAENVTFTYDNCAFGIGRVCERRDESGVYTYAYDVYGNVTQENYTIDGIAYVMDYSYDADHNVIAMTYPGGRVVNYTRDNLDRVTDITAGINGASSTIVSAITYRADGQLDSLTYGNGLTENRALDLQARLREQAIAGVDTIDYAYDPDSNLLSRDAANDAHAYRYDALDRVVGDNFNGTAIDFTYDPNDNRLSQQIGSSTLNYLIGADSNRLNRVANTVLTYDGAGNLTQDAQGRQLIYNNVGRLERMTGTTGVIADYIYDADGLRRKKITPTETVIYHYDHNGQLMTETTLSGVTQRDYIWLMGMVYAQVDVSGGVDSVTYLHCDHLYTPRIGTDASGQVVWRWESDAFGTTVPSGTQQVNLRFPGQYFDAESGLHYNWNRYYDPQLGRYITSDPIGLDGGMNTYAYVDGNPGRYVDPTGEFGLFGAVIGGVIDLGLQLLQNGGNLSCVNWGQVAGSAALGVVTGGLGSLGRAATANAFKHSVSGAKWANSSKKWNSVQQRYRRYHNQNGSAPRGDWEAHHWAFGRGGRTGPSWRNHPLNLNPLPKNVHRRIHGSWQGQPKFNAAQQWWYGTPNWYKQGQTVGGVAGGVAGNSVGSGGGCGCNP